MTDVTRDQIKDRVYQLLWETSDVAEFDELTIVVPKMNNIVDRICKWSIVSITDKRKYRAWYLPFLHVTAFYTFVQPKSNTVAVATSDTEITVDTTKYLDATSLDPQYLLINGDIIQYTGKTSTQFTGVTWISVVHQKWQLVYQLYKAPSAVSKPYNLFQQIDTQTRREVDHVDFRKPIYHHRYYSILRDGSQDLLNIVWYSWDDIFTLDYIKQSDDMTTGSSICTIPDAIELVAQITAWELLWENEEYEDGTTKLDHWYTLLDEMYTFYAKQTWKNEVRVRHGINLGFNYAYPTYASRARYRLR